MRKLGGPAGREGNIRQPFFRPSAGKPIIAAMHGYVYGAGLRIAVADLPRSDRPDTA